MAATPHERNRRANSLCMRRKTGHPKRGKVSNTDQPNRANFHIVDSASKTRTALTAAADC